MILVKVLAGTVIVMNRVGRRAVNSGRILSFSRKRLHEVRHGVDLGFVVTVRRPMDLCIGGMGAAVAIGEAPS